MPAQNKHRKIEIQEVLDQWARYRQGKIDGGTGWPKKTILGKLRDGLPTNLCPICIGKEKPAHNCPVCGGDGRVKLDVRDNKANPAFIRGNGPVYSHDDDPQSQKVDWIICTELSQDQREVVILTYTHSDTQLQKARKLGVSQQHFSKELADAHILIQEALER